ncbi:unnamed protein product [Arctia plantaginis]|uniref:C2H2-type domain-containing protein n=1 Tax=Arctia plantaginis TaxID=874455 RepID=A0A8S0ZYA1_ARCPL|nr:unnamed protein product [Arctia plantaginis]
MGAKAPEKLKLRRQSCKCEVCGRKFLNHRALISHRKFVHKTSIETKRVSVKKPPDLQDSKVITKSTDNKTYSKIGAEEPSSKVKNKNDLKVTAVKDSKNKRSTTKKRIEFKCPRCIKVFSVYFSAYRHIQKSHCVDKNDLPVQPNSSDLIRPIRVELFDCCNKFLPISEDHVCTEVSQERMDRFMCLGCQKTFDSLALFEQHVKVLHALQADCLYFPSNAEFTTWKSDLEAVTKVKFQTLAPSVVNSKHIYHCSHQPPIETDKSLLCPSSLIVTELNNGYQVIYYKEHFGHSCLDLPQLKYKTNSILQFLKDIDIQHVDSDEHVHQQLKSIMNNVMASAPKGDIGVLYTLLDKALEMTLVLNNVGLEDQTVVNKSLTDNQITAVLSEVGTYPAKRKAESVKKDVKLNKLDEENGENIKNDSLFNKTVLNKTVAKKAVESLPSTPLQKTLIQSSPSFNDTYKNFVDQNFKSTTDTSTPKKHTIKKKTVMKTKIGQFKVRPSLSPKGSVVETSPIKIKPQESPKMSKLGSSPKRLQIHSNLLLKNARPVVSPKSMKPSLSPKISKPSMSPKTKHTAIKLVGYKIKPDFKYEVKEQENDCNILILKI